jgi:hypothetical protein
MSTNHAHAHAPAALRDDALVGGWVLASYLAVVASFLIWPAFVAWGGLWFTISDALGLVMATVTIPVVVGLDKLFAPGAPGLARSARWIGILGLSLIAAGSILLIANQVNHEFLPGQGGLGVQIAGWGLWGGWLAMTGTLARRTGTFGGRVVWSARAIGVGILIGMVGAFQGPEHPLTMIGGLAMFAGLSVWTFAVRSEAGS